MIRYLLILLYILAVAEATVELDLGIGTGLSVKNLLLYTLIISIFARAVLVNTNIHIPLFKIHIPFLLFAVFGVLSWAMNSLFDPTYPSVRGLITLKSDLVDNFLYFIVFFFGANNYKEAKEIFLFGLHLIAIISVMTILDMSNFVDLGLMEQDPDGRVQGPIGESNQYGAFMVFFVPLFAAMALGSKGFARLSWWLVFFCGFGLLIATGSRGAYLGIFSATVLGLRFIVPYFGRRDIRTTAIKMAAVLFVISMAVGIANRDLVVERIEQSTSTDIQELSSGRSAIWRATILVQAEQPYSFIVGNGWNSHDNSGIWKSAHNTYLLIFFELGLIGLLLFITLLASVVTQIRVLIARTEGKERILMSGVAFGLIGVIVSIMFVDLSIPWFYIWSFIGMSLRIAYEKDQEYILAQKDIDEVHAERFA